MEPTSAAQHDRRTKPVLEPSREQGTHPAGFPWQLVVLVTIMTLGILLLVLRIAAIF
jgi:hypothetical protein